MPVLQKRQPTLQFGDENFYFGEYPFVSNSGSALTQMCDLNAHGVAILHHIVGHSVMRTAPPTRCLAERSVGEREDLGGRDREHQDRIGTALMPEGGFPTS